MQALHAFIRKRSEVGGGAKVRARGFGVFAEGSPRRSLRTPPTSGAAKRTGDSACFVSHQLWYNMPLTRRTGVGGKFQKMADVSKIRKFKDAADYTRNFIVQEIGRASCRERVCEAV